MESKGHKMSGKESKGPGSGVLETQKLKAQIEILQKKKKDALEELGNIVYESSSRGLFDEEYIKEKCEAITEIDREATEIEAQLVQIYLKAKESIQSLKAIALCDCGAELYEDANFCSKCGKKVKKSAKKEQQQVEEKIEPENVCPECGAQLSEGADFCNKCGSHTKSPYL
jgi:ribosomal protein L40E